MHEHHQSSKPHVIATPRAAHQPDGCQVMDDVRHKILGGTEEKEGKAGQAEPLGVPGSAFPERCPGSRDSCAGCQAQTDAALKWLLQIPAPGVAFPCKHLFPHSQEHRFKVQTSTSTCLAFDVNPKGKYERPVKPDLGHVVPVLGWQQGL